MDKQSYLKKYNSIIGINKLDENISETVFKNYYKNKKEYVNEELFFVIPLKPKAKSRPRMNSNGVVFDPDEKEKNYYIEVVKYILFEELQKISDIDLTDIDSLFRDGIVDNDEEIGIEVIYYINPPANTSKNKLLQMLDGTINPTVGQDIDNYDKFLYDVLQLTDLFKNDTNIISHNNYKKYSLVPRIEVKLNYKRKLE